MVKTATSQNGDSQNGDIVIRKLKCFYIYIGTSIVNITISDGKKFGGKAIMGTVVVTL